MKSVENGRKPFPERLADGQIPSNKTAFDGTHTQIYDGHRDLETDSAQWAD